MKKSEILETLAHKYKIGHQVYVSMEEQAYMALEKGKMRDYKNLTKRAAYRAATLSGIKQSALALGITESDFMDAVNA